MVDPTLWPQPWVSEYPHLGAIPRKPDDCNDPTRKELDSYDCSLVDGIGELLKSKFLEFDTMRKNLEDRIEDYKTARAAKTYFASFNHL
jgi:hypothetical protein